MERIYYLIGYATHTYFSEGWGILNAQACGLESQTPNQIVETCTPRQVVKKTECELEPNLPKPAFQKILEDIKEVGKQVSCLDFIYFCNIEILLDRI